MVSLVQSVETKNDDNKYWYKMNYEYINWIIPE